MLDSWGRRGREAELVSRDEDAERRPPGSEPDLRAIISRLEEIRRKCHSLRTRNDETENATFRLEQVIGSLQTASTSGSEPPAGYRALARQLYPVLRLFESLGFLSVAREIAYVEKALDALDPTPPGAAEAPSIASPTLSPATPATEPEPAVAEEDRPPQVHRRVPGPVAAMLLVLLLVILGAVLVVHRQAERGARISNPGPEPTSAAAAPADLAPPPTMRPVAPPASPTESVPRGAAIVAEEIAQARLALGAGDLDRAIHHVSRAALVDLSSSLVLDTGQAIVRQLLARSDDAADNGRWETAAGLVERARELSIRFGFPLSEIDETARRHQSLERFRVIAPSDIGALRAAVGRRVMVIFDDGSRREGAINAVGARVLKLEQYRQIGGGGRVYYVDQVPLEKVREIRLYDE